MKHLEDANRINNLIEVILEENAAAILASGALNQLIPLINSPNVGIQIDAMSTLAVLSASVSFMKVSEVNAIAIILSKPHIFLRRTIATA